MLKCYTISDSSEYVLIVKFWDIYFDLCYCSLCNLLINDDNDNDDDVVDDDN